MKKLLILTLLSVGACSAQSATAGGLTPSYDDPVVTPPAAPMDTWTGLYGGLSYAKGGSSTTGQRCFKLGDPKDCNDPVFDYYPELKEVEEYSLDGGNSELFGVFAGYRKDLGQWVVGGEVNWKKDFSTAGVQLGLDLGKALAYTELGYAVAGDESGAEYGLGVDFLLDQNLLLGAKATETEFGVSETSIRLGWKF